MATTTTRLVYEATRTRKAVRLHLRHRRVPGVQVEREPRTSLCLHHPHHLRLHPQVLLLPHLAQHQPKVAEEEVGSCASQVKQW